MLQMMQMILGALNPVATASSGLSGGVEFVGCSICCEERGRGVAKCEGAEEREVWFSFVVVVVGGLRRGGYLCIGMEIFNLSAFGGVWFLWWRYGVNDAGAGGIVGFGSGLGDFVVVGVGEIGCAGLLVLEGDGVVVVGIGLGDVRSWGWNLEEWFCWDCKIL